MYGKEVDDSDWDIDSDVAPSVKSYNSGKVKGLESIYLQRLEGAKRRKNKRA